LFDYGIEVCHDAIYPASLHREKPMSNQPRKYPTENHLVEDLCATLRSQETPWGEVKLAREFNHRSGRTDVVALDDDLNLIAFEAKLLRWRDALQQAYRNTSFAHFSYVVLPEEVALRAQQYTHEFRRRAVGLCYPKDGALVVCLPAKKTKPILPWVSKTAILQIQRR
jgi:hypothetical protein